MNSKKALQKMSNYIERLNGGETLEEEEIIIRDLEKLEQIKVKIDEEIKKQEKVIIEYENYAWKTQRLNTEYLIAFNVKNALEKIKEWLENDK